MKLTVFDLIKSMGTPPGARWITIHPHGGTHNDGGHDGQHIMIDGSGNILAGGAPEWKGRNIAHLKGTHKVEEKPKVDPLQGARELAGKHESLSSFLRALGDNPDIKATLHAEKERTGKNLGVLHRELLGKPDPWEELQRGKDNPTPQPEPKPAPKQEREKPHPADFDDWLKDKYRWNGKDYTKFLRQFEGEATGHGEDYQEGDVEDYLTDDFHDDWKNGWKKPLEPHEMTHKEYREANPGMHPETARMKWMSAIKQAHHAGKLPQRILDEEKWLGPYIAAGWKTPRAPKEKMAGEGFPFSKEQNAKTSRFLQHADYVLDKGSAGNISDGLNLWQKDLRKILHKEGYDAALQYLEKHGGKGYDVMKLSGSDSKGLTHKEYLEKLANAHKAEGEGLAPGTPKPAPAPKVKYWEGPKDPAKHAADMGKKLQAEDHVQLSRPAMEDIHRLFPELKGKVSDKAIINRIDKDPDGPEWNQHSLTLFDHDANILNKDFPATAKELKFHWRQGLNKSLLFTVPDLMKSADGEGHWVTIKKEGPLHGRHIKIDGSGHIIAGHGIPRSVIEHLNNGRLGIDTNKHTEPSEGPKTFESGKQRLDKLTGQNVDISFEDGFKRNVSGDHEEQARLVHELADTIDMLKKKYPGMQLPIKKLNFWNKGGGRAMVNDADKGGNAIDWELNLPNHVSDPTTSRKEDVSFMGGRKVDDWGIYDQNHESGYNQEKLQKKIKAISSTQTHQDVIIHELGHIGFDPKLEDGKGWGEARKEYDEWAKKTDNLFSGYGASDIFEGFSEALVEHTRGTYEKGMLPPHAEKLFLDTIHRLEGKAQGKSAPPQQEAPEKSEPAPKDDAKTIKVGDHELKVKGGKVVSGAENGLHMPYVRVHQPKGQKTQNFGSTYGQDIEPHGEYMSHDSMNGTNKIDQPNYEYGKIHFKNPLFLEHEGTGHGGWKSKLSEQFGGKTGKALSTAVKKAGHDGIVTFDSKYGALNETVNLAGEKAGQALQKSLIFMVPDLMKSADSAGHWVTIKKEGPLHGRHIKIDGSGRIIAGHGIPRSVIEHLNNGRLGIDPNKHTSPAADPEDTRTPLDRAKAEAANHPNPAAWLAHLRQNDKDAFDSIGEFAKKLNMDRPRLFDQFKPKPKAPEKPAQTEGPNGHAAPEPHPAHVEKALQDHERTIRGSKTEMGTLHHPDTADKVWGEDQGKKDEVDLSDAVRKGLVKGNILTHNHPSGNSFSKQDINFMLAHGLKEIRAVSTKHIHRIQPPKGHDHSDLANRGFFNRVNEEEEKVRKEFESKINSGTMTVEQAMASHFHELWTRMAKLTGLRYERSEWHD